MEIVGLKNVLLKVLEFFEDIGRARAAAELARAGKIKEARVLMTSKTEFDVHP